MNERLVKVFLCGLYVRVQSRTEEGEAKGKIVCLTESIRSSVHSFGSSMMLVTSVELSTGRMVLKGPRYHQIVS